MSSSSSQPIIATGKAVAPPRSNSRSGLTQVSLAQLLGVQESSASSVTLTLNMTSDRSEPAAAVAKEPAMEFELADHERNRSKKRKAPEGPRGRSKAGRNSVEAKHVPMLNRLKEFPNQGLKISAGALFCKPCAVTLPNIKSSIVSHVATSKHKSKVLKYEQQRESDNVTRTELAEYFMANLEESQVSVVHLPTARVWFLISFCLRAHSQQWTRRSTYSAFGRWKPFSHREHPSSGWNIFGRSSSARAFLSQMKVTCERTSRRSKQPRCR